MTINSDFMQYAYEKSVEHNEKYHPVIFKTIPELESIEETCTFGVFSRTLIASKRHYSSIAASVDINGATCTITQLSRLYLDYYHPRRLRAFGALTRKLWELRQNPPLYVNRTIIPQGTYVDIKSTYYSLLTLVGWNADYYPSRWLIQGRLPLDYPLKDDKIARAYLVTGSLKSVVGIWNGKKAFYRKTHNPHINYALWGLVTDILHCIAQYAVSQCEAVYVHTDGYIVPEHRTEQLINHIATWGLTAGVKHQGETMVCGFSNFICGERITKGFDPTRVHDKVDGIDWDIDREWLRTAVYNATRSDNGMKLYSKSVR
jgi:hypothetical protein